MALSLQELSIRKTAVQLNVPESIVELIINHKNKAMYEALYLHKSVEDSGLGKFLTRTSKIRKKLLKLDLCIDFTEERLHKEDITEKEQQKQLKLLKQYLEEKEYLESKI